MRRVKRNSNVLSKVIVGLLVLIAVLQLITIYGTYSKEKNTQGVAQSQEERMEKQAELLEAVSKHVTIEEGQNPAFAVVTDAENLKNANVYQSQVYKDAQNGDQILAFGDRVIIYNEARDEVVYDGKSPLALKNEKYLQELRPLQNAISQLTDLPQDEQPRIATIGDVEKLIEQNPQVYADAQKGDKMLVYENRVIIYRPLDDEIIFDGEITVQENQ